MWIHIFSDVFIAFLYVMVPISLCVCSRYVNETGKFPIRRIFILASVFLIALGLFNVIQSATLDTQIYRITGVFKAVIGILSGILSLIWTKTRSECALPSIAIIESRHAKIASLAKAIDDECAAAGDE